MGVRAHFLFPFAPCGSGGAADHLLLSLLRMKPNSFLRRIKLFFLLIAIVLAVATFGLHLAVAQKKEIVWSAEEKPLADQINGLRSLADDVRAVTT
jgi:hypothetical protein